MLEVEIPGFGVLRVAHLVLDYNGTLAVDGRLLDGVAAELRALATQLQIHVLTADTFGLAQSELADLPVSLVILPVKAQAEAKLAHVKRLGASAVVAIGNGRNNRKMLKAAALGIVIVQPEGAAAEAVAAGDLVSTSVLHALALLHNPRRLIATLRS